MAKYKVEVGGFVTVYRKRTFTIYAADETEAEEKAIDRFIDVQQNKTGNVCEEGTVNSIEEIF